MPEKPGLQLHLSTLMGLAFALGFWMFANWKLYGMLGAMGSGSGAFPLFLINVFVLFPLTLFIMGFTKLLCDHLSLGNKDRDASGPDSAEESEGAKGPD